MSRKASDEKLSDPASSHAVTAGSPGRPKVVVLFGATGVGKTNLLFDPIFEKTEIISADSMQVYRGMDIGTAKPDTAEQALRKHHLIDVMDPDCQYDVGAFVEACEKLIPEIHSRGNVPVIAGGTGYYIKNFLMGLPETPESVAEIRNALQLELAERGRNAMLAELSEFDSVSAERIPPENTQRLLRAIEVYRISGRPLSSYKLPDTVRSDFDFLILGLTREREELYERINQRVELMFGAGLPSEFDRLIKEGWKEDDPGMKAIGYREFFTPEADLHEVKELIKRNSRRYAKRQITFFKGIPGTRWHHPEEIDTIKGEISAFIGADTTAS